MSFAFELLKAFSRPRRGGGKLSLHIILAAMGISVGVFAVIVVMAGFEGFFHTFETLLVSTTPHIEIKKNIKDKAEDEKDEYLDIMMDDEDELDSSEAHNVFETDDELDMATIEKSSEESVFTDKNLFSMKESVDILSKLRVFPGVDFAERAFLSSSDLYFFKEDGSFLLKTSPIIYGSSFENNRTALEMDALVDDSKIFKEMGTLASRSDISGILLDDSIFKVLKLKGIEPGQTILLSASDNPFGPRAGKVKLVASFSYGLKLDSQKIIITDLKMGKLIFDTDDSFNSIIVRLKDKYLAKPVARKIKKTLQEGYYAFNWATRYEKPFNYLQILKTIIFITLLMIIVVGAFSIMNSLAMVVIEKRKQIAILKAIGAKNSHIYIAFLYLSLLIGSLGMIVGVVMGRVGVLFVENIQSKSLNEALGVNQINFVLETNILIYLFFPLIIICMFSALSPARKAAKIMPVEGLR